MVSSQRESSEERRRRASKEAWMKMNVLGKENLDARASTGNSRRRFVVSIERLITSTAGRSSFTHYVRYQPVLRAHVARVLPAPWPADDPAAFGSVVADHDHHNNVSQALVVTLSVYADAIPPRLAYAGHYNFMTRRKKVDHMVLKSSLRAAGLPMRRMAVLLRASHFYVQTSA